MCVYGGGSFDLIIFSLSLSAVVVMLISLSAVVVVVVLTKESVRYGCGDDDAV